MKIGKPKWLMRWRFDFANKPSKFGMWNSPGPRQHGAHAAWSTNKEGLVRASIEGKDIYTREVRTLVACDGHNFVNMKWHAEIRHSVGAYGHFPGKPIGMILQTRDEDVLYLMDGQWGRRPRTAQDQDFNYAGFGK